VSNAQTYFKWNFLSMRVGRRVVIDHSGNGEKVWPVDHYLVEGPRDRNWFVDRVVKQHRTITTYLDLLRASGFTLLRLVEWGPNGSQVAAHPEWAEERQWPMFMLVSTQFQTPNRDALLLELLRS
jgi:hypothetical protein